MILTCPNCGSQFRVNASMIPHEGREVRCASCKHQWHAYPEGRAVELNAPEPALPADLQLEDEKPDLIAFADPEPEPLQDVPAQEEAERADALPEDAFEDDSCVISDDPLPSMDEDLLHEPELISAIDDDPYGFAPEEMEGFTGNDAPKNASLAPLAALASLLLVAVIATSFFALRPAMQNSFGFVYAMFGAKLTDGLALTQVQLRERPSRSKARFIVEGEIVNAAQEARAMPLLRVMMIGLDGAVIASREYVDESAAMIEPGESRPFKASNLETSKKDALAYFLVDIGSGGELMLRKPTHGVPDDG